MRLKREQREHFETSTDVRELFKQIVEDRRQRENATIIDVLNGFPQ